VNDDLCAISSMGEDASVSLALSFSINVHVFSTHHSTYSYSCRYKVGDLPLKASSFVFACVMCGNVDTSAAYVHACAAHALSISYLTNVLVCPLSVP
jgi:hypothetical protein